jgi:hypothetical protein
MTTVRLQVILTVPLEDGANHDQVRRGVLAALVGLPVVNATGAWAEITAVEIQTSELQHEPGLSRALAAADVPVDRSDFLDPVNPPDDWRPF